MAPSNRKGVDYVENVKQPDKWQDPSTEVKNVFYDISKNNPRSKDNISLLTEDQRDQWVQMLVLSVFRMVNKDWKENTAAYEASITKCLGTRVLDAGVWSEWGGQRDVRTKLSDMLRHSTADGRLYVLPAPTLVAIVAVKFLRDLQTRNNDDEASVLLEKLSQLDYLGFAIDNYKPGAKYIATDIAWKVDPDVQEPQPVEDQLAEAKKLNEALQNAKRNLKEKTKERARREEQNAQPEKPKSKAAESAKQPSQTNPQTTQATPKPKSKTAESAKNSSQTNPQTRQVTPKPKSKTAESAKNSSNLSSADANRPDKSQVPVDTQPIYPPRKMVEVKIKRDEALEAIGELIKRVSAIYDEGQEAVDEDEYKALCEQLQQAVAEQIVIVLPEQEKNQLGIWALVEKRNEIRQWLRAANEDRTEHSWMEEVADQDDRTAGFEETDKELLQRVKGLEETVKGMEETVQQMKEDVQEMKEAIFVMLELVKADVEHRKFQDESFKQVAQKTTDIERSIKTMVSFMKIGKKRSHNDAFDNKIKEEDGLA